MTPTPERWDEARLSSLVPQEHDSQEFKSSLFVCDATGVVRADFADNLSKQVSAFSNAGGGFLFLGIDDKGCPDAGVSRTLKPNGTREWLEDMVRAVVDPPIKEYNVYEVTAEGPGSPIEKGRAVYVLEIPDSENAPHQARDRRYYLRIAGKSRPMSHRHVLDVLHRRRDPQVQVDRVDPYGEPELFSDPRGPTVLLRLRGTLTNRGGALAQHVGCEFVLPRFAVNSEARRRTLGAQVGVQQSQRPGEVKFFFYHPTPVFPQQEINPFGEVWITLHGANLSHYKSGRVVLRWRVYADAAPFLEGQVDVAAFSAVKRAIRLVRKESTRAPAAE